MLTVLLALAALTTKAQVTIYESIYVNVGAMLSSDKVTYLKGERADGFKVIVNEAVGKIYIESGDEKERWMTITIEKKEIDKNGDFLFSGCATYDGITKPIERKLCLCELFILSDEIILYWNPMVFNYYRGTSTIWGNYPK